MTVPPIFARARAAAVLPCALLTLAAAAAKAQEPPKPAHPNILVILADDMGYSDIGCFGSEIHTPNIDRLASDGVRFTQTYNCARCSPSRACLLTGLYPHETGMGLNYMGTSDNPAYKGYINEHSATIADVLSGAGYKTMMSGKWHIGHDRPHWPRDSGFDQFWGILDGASNYFRPGKNSRMVQNDDPVVVGKDFYMTDAITDHCVDFLQHDGRGAQPFFFYLAYTAPHWPLQAHPEDIAKYQGKYLIGWDEVRRQRFERMRKLGVLDPQWELSPRDTDAPSWDDEKNKVEMDRRMAVYAAQIECMDRGIGRVLDTLAATGADKNTLIFFLSDNGASAEVREKGGPDVQTGGVDSFRSYTLPWANVSNTPFRLFKSWVNEGGISTPMIIRWPGVVPAGGAWHREVTHLIDVMPTCLEAAGAHYPEESHGNKLYPLDGKSLVPLLKGDRWERDKPLVWEHEGNAAAPPGEMETGLAQGRQVGTLRHGKGPHGNARCRGPASRRCRFAAKRVPGLGEEMARLADGRTHQGFSTEDPCGRRLGCGACRPDLTDRIPVVAISHDPHAPKADPVVVGVSDHHDGGGGHVRRDSQWSGARLHVAEVHQGPRADHLYRQHQHRVQLSCRAVFLLEKRSDLDAPGPAQAVHDRRLHPRGAGATVGATGSEHLDFGLRHHRLAIRSRPRLCRYLGTAALRDRADAPARADGRHQASARHADAAGLQRRADRPVRPAI